jgi:hypothetical protein
VSNFEKLKTFEPLPSSITIRESSIHGLRSFCNCKKLLQKQSLESHIKDKRFSHGYIRTPLGGFFNHSEFQTAKLYMMEILLKLSTITRYKSLVMKLLLITQNMIG